MSKPIRTLQENTALFVLPINHVIIYFIYYYPKSKLAEFQYTTGIQEKVNTDTFQVKGSACLILSTQWWTADVKNAVLKRIIRIGMNTYHDQLIMSAMDTGNIYMTCFIIPSMDALGQAILDSNPGLTTY